MRHDGKSTGLFQEEEEDYNLEEETKYKLKLDTPKSEPAFGGSDGEDESLDAFDDAEGDDLSFGDDKGGDNEKPFDDEPFDAGVEADEDEDPEKYIQQIAGKLGTSLRKYNDERGEPDFDLEKYAINSVISATHTSEMDEEDQKDIIRKVKTSGAGDDNDDIDKDLDIDSEEPKDGVEEIEETLYEDSWSNPMEISEGVEVSNNLQYHLDNKIALGEGLFRYGSDAYVKLYTEVKTLNDLNAIKLNENDEKLIEDFTNQSIIIEGERILLNLIIENDVERILEEGDKYKGKKSNSPSRGAGGGKAYKVFVPGCAAKTKSNPRGIKKISFGSGGLKAKLSNKEAKKSYNARHGCSKGRHNDKCKAGYWSCRLPRYAKKLGLSGGGTWW
tara:strand:- start:12778 stop:13938 length:1161 start_codon:yes stop_codon:yes gene_type:complete